VELEDFHPPVVNPARNRAWKKSQARKINEDSTIDRD
jgi:hypothetical protein